ncbi:hypothetical protein BDQ17DRAFT_1441689 [Cyathus striatus]|nr:hypothetical protein BDQ17DRAFT_1441689 [Cyathus striatus]
MAPTTTSVMCAAHTASHTSTAASTHEACTTTRQQAQQNPLHSLPSMPFQGSQSPAPITQSGTLRAQPDISTLAPLNSTLGVSGPAQNPPDGAPLPYGGDLPPSGIPDDNGSDHDTVGPPPPPPLQPNPPSPPPSDHGDDDGDDNPPS